MNELQEIEVSIDATGIHENDPYMGYGETRWFELELDPSKPELLKAKSYSDEVYGAPAIDPWPPWIGPIVPFNDMGSNTDRLADTNGGVGGSRGMSSPTYVDKQGMLRD